MRGRLGLVEGAEVDERGVVEGTEVAVVELGGALRDDQLEVAGGEGAGVGGLLEGQRRVEAAGVADRGGAGDRVARLDVGDVHAEAVARVRVDQGARGDGGRAHRGRGEGRTGADRNRTGGKQRGERDEDLAAGGGAGHV